MLDTFKITICNLKDCRGLRQEVSPYSRERDVSCRDGLLEGHQKLKKVSMRRHRRPEDVCDSFLFNDALRRRVTGNLGKYLWVLLSSYSSWNFTTFSRCMDVSSAAALSKPGGRRLKFTRGSSSPIPVVSKKGRSSSSRTIRTSSLP